VFNVILTKSLFTWFYTSTRNDKRSQAVLEALTDGDISKCVQVQVVARLGC